MMRLLRIFTTALLVLGGCSSTLESARAPAPSSPRAPEFNSEPQPPEPTPATPPEVAPAEPVVAVAEPSGPDAPPGFPGTDEFADAATACAELVARLVAREDLREPILRWCEVRAYRSSRNGVVRSRLDGSWIHDRDRPSAYSFYRQGLAAGHLDPETCSHHAVDESITRDRAARDFPSRWPYGTYCDRSQGECSPSRRGHMFASVAKDWHRHAPDYERFGTRGPIDNNAWVAVKYLGGCFAPEALDRYDVSVAVTIERAEDLCLRLEARVNTRAERQAAKAANLPTRCNTHSDLRAIWHPRFWYSRLPEALRGL